MFKESFNSKQQGNVGIGAAILYFTKLGNTVCLPLNDSQDYDLVVDINNELFKVQVKTTRRIVDNKYVVCLKSSGGTKGEIYHTVSKGNADLLFVLCANEEMYLIPRSIFVNFKTSITFGNKMSSYKL